MNFFRIRGIFRPHFSASRGKRGFFSGNRRYANYVYFDGPRGNRGGYNNFFFGSRPKKYVTYTAVIFGLICATHVEQAPVTHRRRLMLCPRWVEDDVGKMSYRSIMSQYGDWMLPERSPTAIRVKRVMGRLIYAAQNYHDPDSGKVVNLFEDLNRKTIPVTDWKIHVIDDVAMGRETPNAFVIGDGKVFVFRSILPLCGNDDGLATVLSHELGHQLAHHIGEKLTQSPFYITLSLLSYSIFGSSNLGDLAVSLGVERPQSRAMETEADYIGLMLMASACFNPHRAPDFWKTMIKFENSNGGSIPEFISTHPSSERRNENLQKWMPKADRQHEMAGCGNLATRFSGLFS